MCSQLCNAFVMPTCSQGCAHSGQQSICLLMTCYCSICQWQLRYCSECSCASHVTATECPWLNGAVQQALHHVHSNIAILLPTVHPISYTTYLGHRLEGKNSQLPAGDAANVTAFSQASTHKQGSTTCNSQPDGQQMTYTAECSMAD